MSQLIDTPLASLVDLAEAQSADNPEKVAWKRAGCTYINNVWQSEDGRPCVITELISK